MNLQQDLSLLESLPQDLLGDILSRVAASSRQDISQCLSVSKTIAAAVQDERVYKKLNLRPQTMLPLITYDHHQLMERCLRDGNPQSHYIEGIKEFFITDDVTVGLDHLKKSAEGSYDNATYLYAILLSCTGNIREGKLWLNSLDWKRSKRRVDRCWREVRRSLRHIILELKIEYATHLANNEPPENCHKLDMDTRCPKCFHYKQMRKFVDNIPFL